jgi:TetR/AcrR family transcriptional regulator, regulator of cefoperazone and chloramphenicol sensitivity
MDGLAGGFDCNMTLVAPAGRVATWYARPMSADQRGENAGPATAPGTGPLDWSTGAAWRHVRPTSARGDRTRRAILEVARHLMAEEGVEAVSLRHVILTAGVGNESAIHYHFGSREGLVVALLHERSAVEPARTRLLAELSDGAAVPLHRAVEILVRPVAVAMTDQRGRDYMRIAAQVIRGLPLEDRVVPDEPSAAAALAHVGAALADVAEPFRSARMGSALTLTAELWAARAAAIEHGVGLGLDEPDFVSNLVEMIVALLTAPVESHAEAVPR